MEATLLHTGTVLLVRKVKAPESIGLGVVAAIGLVVARAFAFFQALLIIIIIIISIVQRIGALVSIPPRRTA